MLRSFATLSLLLMLVAPPAQADGCADRARQLAAETGGTVVSVQERGNGCLVKLLVPSQSGPPVRRSIMVRK